MNARKGGDVTEAEINADAKLNLSKRAVSEFQFQSGEAARQTLEPLSSRSGWGRNLN